jgi:phospholipase C
MADTLDAAGISWKYYASDTGMGWIWSIFQAIHNVRYGPDWNTSIIHPETTILSDAATGNLAGVSWVTPDFYNSDHGGVDHTSGPSWVSAIVNAVGTGPEWNSTAIVVLWDDWGGWYDNVPPPQKDFRGLGIRVPCIIISPYAAKGHVSHTQYEFGSVLKFIEQVFSIPSLGPTSLGYTDRRSNSFLDDDGSFDFTKPPRPFVAIKAPLPASYFFHAAPSHRAPDDD